MSNITRRFESEIQVGCILTLLPYEMFLVLYMLTRPAKTHINRAEHIRKMKIKYL